MGGAEDLGLDKMKFNLVPRAFPLKNGWGKALGTRLDEI